MTFAVEMKEPHVAGDTPAATVTATFDKCNGFYPFDCTRSLHMSSIVSMSLMLRRNWENDLFEDDHLKSGITVWILTLRTTRKLSSERGMKIAPTLQSEITLSVNDDRLK